MWRWGDVPPAHPMRLTTRGECAVAWACVAVSMVAAGSLQAAVGAWTP